MVVVVRTAIIYRSSCDQHLKHKKLAVWLKSIIIITLIKTYLLWFLLYLSYPQTAFSRQQPSQNSSGPVFIQSWTTQHQQHKVQICFLETSFWEARIRYKFTYTRVANSSEAKHQMETLTFTVIFWYFFYLSHHYYNCNIIDKTSIYWRYMCNSTLMQHCTPYIHTTLVNLFECLSCSCSYITLHVTITHYFYMYKVLI